MVRVVWTKEAVDQLDLIRAHVSQFDPAAAERLAARLFDAGDSLAVFPNRGRPVVGQYRELLTVRPYLIRYRVQRDRVVIVRLRHGRQAPLD